MKQAIQEDILRLGREAGLKSFEQVFANFWQHKSVILIPIFFVGEGYHITPWDVLYSEWAANTHLKD